MYKALTSLANLPAEILGKGEAADKMHVALLAWMRVNVRVLNRRRQIDDLTMCNFRGDQSRILSVETDYMLKEIGNALCEKALFHLDSKDLPERIPGKPDTKGKELNVSVFLIKPE